MLCCFIPSHALTSGSGRKVNGMYSTDLGICMCIFVKYCSRLHACYALVGQPKGKWISELLQRPSRTEGSGACWIEGQVAKLTSCSLFDSVYPILVAYQPHTQRINLYLKCSPTRVHPRTLPLWPVQWICIPQAFLPGYISAYLPN